MKDKLKRPAPSVMRAVINSAHSLRLNLTLLIFYTCLPSNSLYLCSALLREKSSSFVSYLRCDVITSRVDAEGGLVSQRMDNVFPSIRTSDDTEQCVRGHCHSTSSSPEKYHRSTRVHPKRTMYLRKV